jgi:hypothetical protein
MWDFVVDKSGAGAGFLRELRFPPANLHSTVVARLDAGIVGSNPTRGMDVYVYVYVYSMFVLSCVGRGLAMS